MTTQGNSSVKLDFGATQLYFSLRIPYKDIQVENMRTFI